MVIVIFMLQKLILFAAIDYSCYIVKLKMISLLAEIVKLPKDYNIC